MRTPPPCCAGPGGWLQWRQNGTSTHTPHFLDGGAHPAWCGGRVRWHQWDRAPHPMKGTSQWSSGENVLRITRAGVGSSNGVLRLCMASWGRGGARPGTGGGRAGATRHAGQGGITAWHAGQGGGAARHTVRRHTQSGPLSKMSWDQAAPPWTGPTALPASVGPAHQARR